MNANDDENSVVNGSGGEKGTGVNERKIEVVEDTGTRITGEEKRVDGAGTDHRIAGRYWRGVMDAISLPLAVVSLLAWFLFMVDGYPIGNDFEAPLLVDSLDNLQYALLAFLVVILLLGTLTGPDTRDAIISTFSVVAGTTLAWLLVQFYLGDLIPPAMAPRQVAGLFLYRVPNGLVFLLLGMGLLMLVASLGYRAMVRAAIGGGRWSLDVLLACAATVPVLLLHEWLMQWNVLPVLMVASPAITLSGVLARAAGSGMDKHSRGTLEIPRGGRKLFTGISAFIGMLVVLYMGISTAMATFFYFVIDLALLLFAGGTATAIVAVEAISWSWRGARRRPGKLDAAGRTRAGKGIPWQVLFVCAVLLVALNCAVFLLTYSFTGSTYETNPPFPLAGFLAGLVTGLFTCALINSARQFVPRVRRPGKTRPRRTHEAGRLAAWFGLAGITVWAILDGLGDVTFASWFGETLAWTMVGSLLVAVFLAVVFVVDHAITRKKRGKDAGAAPGTAPASAAGIDERKHSEEARRHGHRESMVVAISRVALVSGLAVLVLGTSLLPVVNTDTASTHEAVTPLFSVNGCTVTRVPALVRVGRFAYLGQAPPLGASGLAPAGIQVSMARNEWESVQIAIRNDGPVPVTVLEVSISNDTSDGHPAAFARPPVNKTWKNETWEWQRFTANHVEEIQPGYPNILYEIGGNQTSVEFAPGDAGPKPEPTIQPGSVKCLWLTLYAGDDLAAGMYSDLINIRTTSWACNVSLITRIWNFSIPVEHGLRVAIGNRRVYNLDTSDEFVKNYLQHRISPYAPNRMYYPIFYRNNNSFDEASMAEFLAGIGNALAYGLDSFRITYRPGAFTFDEEFNASTIAFYSRLGNELGNRTIAGPGGVNQTWLDRAIVYAIDEPNEDEYEMFNKWSDLVHSAHPGWKVLLTEQVEPELLDHVDIWCPHISLVNISNVPIQKAAGKQFWYYTCCNLVNKPTVSFVEPPTAHQALFWAAFAMGFDGYLFWDANAYVNVNDRDPFRVGYDGIGDAIMILSDGNQKPVNTITWESMRDGLEMAEYFKMLEENGVGEDILSTVRDSWGSFTGYPRAPEIYQDLREQAGMLLDSAVSG